MTDVAIETGITPPIGRDEAIAALRAQQNLGLAVPAGLAAALVGAVVWALFVDLTQMKLGLIAVGIGALVGYAIRKTGHGLDRQFGILGGVCAAIGWALGTVLSDVAFLAKDAGRPFLDVLLALGGTNTIMFAFRAADAMDILFLAIAVWEGWKLSFAYKLRK